MAIAPVHLRDILADAQESCAWVGTSHPLTVSLPELPAVQADRGMIAKVLCNLLENAAKYSAPDTPIFVSAEHRDGFVVTSIADRGVGIDIAEQSLIFDRLYRSRSQSQHTSGTGMGLPISRAIVEANHGVLNVTSQVNHGSVFSFSLPSAPSPALG